MKYYLDCEFDGFKGALLSLALVREDGYAFYGTCPILQRCDPWVAENVVPLLYDVPPSTNHIIHRQPRFRTYLEAYIGLDPAPHVVADDEQDIMYLCEQLKDSGGTYAPSTLPGLTFEVARVDAYPTTLPGAVQHNAYWDAMALRHYFEQRELDQLELFNRDVS